MPEPTTETLRFGVFELDPSSGELRKQGVRIKLQAQPLQLLVLLLEQPGNIVSREQIRQVLWPADTFVDFDRSLNTAITPSWSLDGDWIYFSSNRAGNYDIWRIRANGAEPQRITRGGGVRPIQSPDGRYVYYALERFETAVWRTPADGGREEMVLPSLSNWANFALSGERIFFIPGVNAALLSTIQSFKPATGEEAVLMQLKRRPVWGLTAQGATVLFSQADRDSSDLMIIDAFPAP